MNVNLFHTFEIQFKIQDLSIYYLRFLRFQDSLSTFHVLIFSVFGLTFGMSKLRRDLNMRKVKSPALINASHYIQNEKYYSTLAAANQKYSKKTCLNYSINIQCIPMYLHVVQKVQMLLHYRLRNGIQLQIYFWIWIWKKMTHS